MRLAALERLDERGREADRLARLAADQRTAEESASGRTAKAGEDGVSVETFGPAAVQARIADIQGRFVSATPAPSRSTAGTSTVGRSAGGGVAAGVTAEGAAAGGIQSAGGFAAALARLAESAPTPATAPVMASPSTNTPRPQGSSPVATGDQVVAEARKYLGIPYVWEAPTRPRAWTAPGWCSGSTPSSASTCPG